MKKFTRLVALAFIILLIAIPILFSIAGATSPETYRSDPDPESTSVDGYACSFYTTGTSWATIRATDHSGPPAIADDSNNGVNILIEGNATANSWTRIYHPILLFDTSALPDAAVITAVTLNMKCAGVQDNISMSPDVVVVSSNPASNTAIAYGDYDTSGTTEYSNVISYGSFSAGNWNTFTLNSSGRAAVSKTGVTKLGLREHTHDLHNSAPAGSGTGISYVSFYSADYTGTTSDPYLTITYALVPTLTTDFVWDVASTTASVSGTVTSTGGENPTVTVYWGDNDGGTTPGNWDHSVAPYSPAQPQGAVAFYADIDSLPSGTTCYWTAKAVNSAGTGWASTDSFLTKPAAPTGVSATDGSYTDKVRITWTKSTGATGYQVYRDGNALGWIGDTNIYDDSGASAATITAGTASATDGDSATYVTLSLAGELANNGTTHTYTVKAKNATGESAASSSNTGYRGVGALSYQWERSAGDSDGSYSDLAGATVDPYNDTDAPASGEGRYYKCTLNATGAAEATSTSDRGYRSVGLDVDTFPITGITSLSATLNGNITMVTSGNALVRGFVYDTVSHPANPGDVEPAASGYSYNTTEAGNYTTGTYSIGTGDTLAKHTTYYVRAYVQNAVGNAYGDEVSFLTWSTTPSVTTLAATSVSLTTARLNGYLTDDGGEDCNVRFQYFTGAGTWTDNETAWQTGKVTGNSFYADIAGLTQGTLYTFRAVADGNGTAYGGNATFTTLTVLSAPTNFVAIPLSDEASIDLTWDTGNGSATTYIVYKIGSYSTSTSDGTFLCETFLSSYHHENLTPGSTYYYSAWGVSGGNTTSTYATSKATVSASTTGGSANAPDEPTNWFADVDYTNLSGLPFYGVINTIVDDFGFAREFFWAALGFIIALLVFIAAYRASGANVMIAGLAAVVILSIEIPMGLMAGFMVFLFAFFAIGMQVIKNKV